MSHVPDRHSMGNHGRRASSELAADALLVPSGQEYTVALSSSLPSTSNTRLLKLESDQTSRQDTAPVRALAESGREEVPDSAQLLGPEPALTHQLRGASHSD